MTAKDIVQLASLTDQNFTFTPHALNLTDNSTASQYEYAMKLENGAEVQIFITLFTNATIMEFANQTITVISFQCEYFLIITRSRRTELNMQ